MTVPLSPPLALTILRQGEHLFVDLAEVGTLIPRGEMRVEETFLREVAAEVRLLAIPGFGHVGSSTQSTPGAGRRQLQRVGSVIFSHLLPESVRVRLRSAPPGDLHLRLDEQLLAIPWELAYDGQDFLATKFRVGRQVITSQPLPGAGTVRAADGPLKILLIADPTESLLQAAAEVEQLCAVLEEVAGVEVTLLGGKNVRKLSLLAAVQEHAVVHFAGHSVYDPRSPGESGWRLHEGILTALELGKLTQPPLLVFSNSCQAGATVAWQTGARYDDQAFGIGSAFLLAGVKNYIGTFWVAHDEESAIFAAAFYRSLTAGRSVGEALRHARHDVIKHWGWQGLTWASYMLYGDPAFTLLPLTHASPLFRWFPPAQSQPVGVLQRKLAAILSADVQGYSRLMGEDEVATIRTLTAYREVMTALIQQHHGRVVDAPGDNLLAEFGSAVDAVQGAVEIQRALKSRNAELPPNRKMEFRIGINVGDVLVEGERIYGDGVNIAARVEALAEGGGICISGTVYDQVETKLALSYEYLGEQTVKNITKPVRVYRWSAVLPSPTQPPQQRASSVHEPKTDPTLSTQSPAPHLVGRDAELTYLHRLLEKALIGDRQIIFVTGEPGIGKTTVVETFLSGIKEQGTGDSSFGPTDPRSPTPDPWIAQGQCIEQYGAGEAYLPILSALGQLCRESEGQRLVETLGKYAPTWLMQMPALLSAADLDALQRKTQGATRERMLREMAEALEALTAEKPLVLWLEDLHWSDYSTLDLIAFLARRRQPARLLVIGTARPVDGTEHPLRTVKQELRLHGQCQEVAVRLLSEEHIAAYLAVRLPVGAHSRAPRQLAHPIHQRTEGNPLFMVNIVDELLTRGKLEDTTVETSTPATIREMIELLLERLKAEEQHVVEVASVTGMEFSAAAVAAGMETAVDEVEQQCTALVRRGQFLQAKGMTEWPDGTISTCYGFLHALYQEVIYGRTPAGRRSRLHQLIGARLEEAHGERAREIATELAMHFAQGRDYPRAVRYAERAGTNALRRNAYLEAIQHFTTGLEFVPRLPDTPERVQQELRLQTALVVPFSATKGYGAPEVERACARARELCEQIGETPQLFTALGGLCSVYHNRAEVTTAHVLAEQLLRLAQKVDNPILLVWGNAAVGLNLQGMGQLVSARDYLERALSLYDPHKHRSYGFVQDPGVSCFCYLTDLLWILGYPDQALESSQRALTLARQLSHPYSLAFALDNSTEIHRVCGKKEVAHECRAALYALAQEQGFVQWLADERTSQGLDLIMQGQKEEGLNQIRQSMTALRAMGHAMRWLGDVTMLAEVYGEIEHYTEGLSIVAEALAIGHKADARVYEPELYRLKGELTLQKFQVSNSRFQVPPNPQPLTLNPQAAAEAEACFHKAIDMARKQSAKSWELRATISLARLWQSQGKSHEAHEMLSEIYNWFTEGFDTKDLQEAKTLLEKLTEQRQEHEAEG